MGNLHGLIKPMRQSFYLKIGLTDPIPESYPEYNKETREVYWVKEVVVPSDENNWMLEDPVKTLDYFLSKVTRPKEGISDRDWSNHLFGLAMLICELISQIKT